MNHSAWLALPSGTPVPGIVYYRRRVEVAQPEMWAIEFTGDEEVELYLDGERIAAGPEHDTADHWHLIHWQGTLTAGTHVFVVRLCFFGPELCAYARTSLRPGVYCRELEGRLDGGWEALSVHGLDFAAPFPDWGVAPRALVGPEFPRDAFRGGGEGWQPAECRPDERVLYPPEAPVSLGEELAFDCREEPGRTLLVFPHYVCAWSEYRFTGHGTVRLRWSECAYQSERFDPVWLKGDKGSRGGSVLIGNADEFNVAGELVWHDWQWRAGTRVELCFTGSAALAGVRFRRAGHPYCWRDRAECSEPRLIRLLEMARRTLAMCSHDTYMDCPYYERMMYLGDARIEALAASVGTLDTTLTEKALDLFARSRDADGMIRSRQPSKCDQTIPAFALIYILMLHDFALWHDRPDRVREWLPTARGIADYFACRRGADGLVRLDGWNFIDWVDGWDNGVPPGSAEDATNSSLNAFYALALTRLAELELHFGTPEAAALRQGQAEAMRRAILAAYREESTGLLADDRAHKHFSEHPQLLFALAFDAPELVERLFRHPTAARAGICFSHYYFDVCARYGKAGQLHTRLEEWYGLADRGLSTLPEEFGNPRSDCHAWSTHPLYHYYASILGIRPVAFGARRFRITPLPGPLVRIGGSLPTPHGTIEVAYDHGRLTVGGSHPQFRPVTLPMVLPQ